jgi:hypothetical protein
MASLKVPCPLPPVGPPPSTPPPPGGGRAPSRRPVSLLWIQDSCAWSRTSKRNKGQARSHYAPRSPEATKTSRLNAEPLPPNRPSSGPFDPRGASQSGKPRRRGSWMGFRQPCRVLLGPRCQVCQHLLPSASTPHAASTARAWRNRRMLIFSPPGVELDAPIRIVVGAPLSRSAPDRLWARSKAQGRRRLIRAVPDFGSTRLHSCDLTIRSPESALPA